MTALGNMKSDGNALTIHSLSDEQSLWFLTQAPERSSSETKIKVHLMAFLSIKPAHSQVIQFNGFIDYGAISLQSDGRNKTQIDPILDSLCTGSDIYRGRRKFI